jgi:hypothetical protein
VSLQTCPWASLALILILTRAAGAQPAAQAPPGDATGVGGSSRAWFVAGTAFATVRGDCQTCEGDYPYRHSASVLANIGFQVNPRMDVGAEVFWMPVDTADGRVNTTHIDAVTQFRPWASQGFFVKGGAGMAFLRNWVDAVGPDAINSKNLSVVIGAGWVLRPTARLGLQLFGAQHVSAIGDLQTSAGDIPDVVGNFWSLGAGVVIR